MVSPPGSFIRLSTDQFAERDRIEAAREIFGRERMARKIFDKNKDKLKTPAELPAGAELKLPVSSWPTVLAFIALALFRLNYTHRAAKNQNAGV